MNKEQMKSILNDKYDHQMLSAGLIIDIITDAIELMQQSFEPLSLATQHRIEEEEQVKLQ